MTTVPPARNPTPPPYPSGRNLLAGKTVLITAAAGTGIGFATAKRAIEEGARVVISDIHQRRLQESLDQLGPNAHAVLGNVTAEDDVQRLVDAARRAHIPVTTVTETMPSQYRTFQAWQVAELRSLLTAPEGSAIS